MNNENRNNYDDDLIINDNQEQVDYEDYEVETENLEYEPESIEYDTDEYEVEDSNELEYVPEEDDEEDDEKSSSSKASLLANPMIKLIAIVGIVFILIILALMLLSSLKGQKTYTYEEVEQVMVTAAKDYFKDNSNRLPANEDQTVQIEATTLATNNKMRPLSEYFADGQSCTGKVNVKKIGSEYSYIPLLNCGSNYSTILLGEKLTESSNLVASGYGLYAVDGGYVYRGEKVNNYVKLDNRLWRIVRINSDKTVYMTTEQPLTERKEFDNRYNASTGKDDGINNYQNSRLREKLQELYAVDDDANYAILSLNDKAHLVNTKVCYGKKNPTDTNKNNQPECTATSSDKLGALTVSDYMMASVDTGCKKVIDEECKNYNFLAEYSGYWLVTANSTNSTEAYLAESGIRSYGASYSAPIRPTITLSSATVIASGDGSYENPYVIK